MKQSLRVVSLHLGRKFRMIYRALAIAFIFLSPTSGENFTEQCEIRGKAIASLDLAHQLIAIARDNYPNCPPKPLPIDCQDILLNGANTSGVYQIWPRSRAVGGPLAVYCDMVTDGGGWTVLQRRGNFLRPKDYFYQDWQNYKKGFGDVDKDFWLGNDNIFGLSNQRLCSVRFDLQDNNGSRRFALYDTFWIDDELHQYTLHISGYRGDAGDSMIRTHNGQKFSTKDIKNDNDPVKNCAETNKGGWWYNYCHSANLNGLYYREKPTSTNGVTWREWLGNSESLEETEMKIRSKDFRK